MKNKMFRRGAALICAALFLPVMSVTAFAQSDEPAEEPTEAVQEATTAKPFTPDGTGTVLDNATNEDGKEFYTITTPNENIFYLIIDRQREEDNVYFLNAVTESDLMALAEPDPAPVITETPTTTPEPETIVPDQTAPEPETDTGASSNMTNIIVIVAVLLVGGAAAYYFKVYRPKHEAPVDDEDEYEYGESDPYGDYEQEDETEYGDETEGEE